MNLHLPNQRLMSAFYDRPTEIVARDLIGKALLNKIGRDWIGGWIVETEAYLDKRDPASHSARGITASNQSMFMRAGTFYVYPIHAKHCLNAVTGIEGAGSAVLIRAIEPVWGVSQMQQNRGLTDLKRLSRGPAMLCQSLGIDRRDDGRSLVDDHHLGIFESPEAMRRRIRSTPRVGISKAVKRRLRFVDSESSFLSRPFRT